MILPKFPQNCMELKKNFGRGGGAVNAGAPPLDPPLVPNPTGDAAPIFDKTKYNKSGLLGWRWEFPRSSLFGSAIMNWITSELYYGACRPFVSLLWPQKLFCQRQAMMNTKEGNQSSTWKKSRSNCWIVIHCISQTWKGDSPKCYLTLFTLSRCS